MPKLSNVVITQKLLENTSGPRQIQDAVVRGLGCRIGKGRHGRRQFFLFTRLPFKLKPDPNTPDRYVQEKVRLSIGSHPEVSIERAREVAREYLRLIKVEKVDPREVIEQQNLERQRAAKDTFGQVVSRFLAEYKGRKGRGISRRTLEGYTHFLSGDLVEVWSSRPVTSIGKHDIGRVVELLEREGKFASARLFRAYASGFFAWCRRRGLVEANPASEVELSSSVDDSLRDRVLTVTEVRHILAAADQLPPPMRVFAWLLALTGQRRVEVASMKWGDLDLDEAEPLWIIPKAKTKNRKRHDVVLTKTAVALINSLPRIAGSAYVMTTDGRSHLQGFSKVKNRLDELIEEERKVSRPRSRPMEEWRFHDLRRTVETWMNEQGIHPQIVAIALNHESALTTVGKRYNFARYSAQRRTAFEAWERALTSDEQVGNVISISRKELG